jgi:3-dehydroquinate dehydratase-2
MNLVIINGPNLNLLGIREPEIYGKVSFEAIFESLKRKYTQAQLSYFQSNHEGELIDKLHEVGFAADGIILNAGGLAHTSIALGDAVAAIDTPVLEVHISNIFAREPYRHHSYVAPKALGTISGLGLPGYELAINFFLSSESR